MLKERGKRLQLRFNIPNIPENKRNVEWMLKQSLKALNSFNIDSTTFQHFSTRFNTVEKGWQTLSTFPFNKIERMLKRMLKSFARALSGNELLRGVFLPVCTKYWTKSLSFRYEF